MNSSQALYLTTLMPCRNSWKYLVLLSLCSSATFRYLTNFDPSTELAVDIRITTTGMRSPTHPISTQIRMIDMSTIGGAETMKPPTWKIEKTDCVSIVIRFISLPWSRYFLEPQDSLMIFM